MTKDFFGNKSLQLVTSLLFLLCYLHTCQTQIISLFTDDEFQGTSASINISSCINLSTSLAGKVSSLNTKGHCARLYDSNDCRGNSVEILARSPSHNKLSDWNFNRKTVSVGPCPNPCSSSVTGRIFDDKIKIQIYSRQDFKGPHREITIKGCTKVPDDFVNQTMSIKTNGHCVQIYNTIDCKSNITADVDTIELRPLTPFHNCTKKWHFVTVKALSHCSFKCPSAATKNIEPPLKNQVYIFRAKNYGSKLEKFNVSTNHCTNFAAKWDGKAESIRLGNKTCVRLFDLRNCTGDWLFLNESSRDLSRSNFDSRASSMNSCLEHVEDVQIPENEYPAETGGISPFLIISIVLAFIAGISLSTVVALIVQRRCMPYHHNRLERLPEKEVQDFLSGFGIDVRRSENSYTQSVTEYTIELLAQNQPYSTKYEIERSRIEYDAGVPLGQGEFGTVYKGTITAKEPNQSSITFGGASGKIPVAIKTINPSSGLHGLRSLLKEVKIMMHLGSHTNIAQMIGCCTENLRQGALFVVMEYCSEGSLESYLLKHRHSYINLVNKGKLVCDSMLKTRLLSEDSGFDIFQIVQWCIHVARGMVFLSNSNVVHSDLAARNILLTENLQAKISDFGLSRQLYNYSQYMKKKQEPLPFRWMALESLKCLEFSTMSDVWGYGVLCWEILSLGEKPYPSLGWNEGFISSLEDGLRLPKPTNATSDFYNLMLRCWEENRSQRPSFTDILHEFEEMFAV